MSDIAKSMPQSGLKVTKDPYFFQPPMLSTWMETAKDAPRWLINDFLPADTNVLVSGPPKRGKKSYLVFNMAMALATGKTVGPFTPTNPTPQNVLILEAEGGKREAYQRIMRLCRGAKIEPTTLPIFFAHRQNISLTNPKWADIVSAFIVEHKISLLVIDTLRMHMDGDENSSEDFTYMARAINQFREAGAAVVYIHHVTKSSNVERDIDEDVRGSGAITGYYDVHFALRAKTGMTYTELTVRSKEDGDKFYEVYWDFQGEGQDEKAFVEVVPVTENARLERVADEVLMVLSANVKPMPPSKLRKELNMDETKVNIVLDMLLAKKAIFKSAKGYSVSRGGVDLLDEE